MSRLFGVVTLLLVVIGTMAFAAANAGHRVTLSLGFITFYQVPVTLVAFSGLFVGMLALFATGIHSDLKVRRILRERLEEESRREQIWIDRTQQDLFAENAGVESNGASDGASDGAKVPSADSLAPAAPKLPGPLPGDQTQEE
jgi:uncharacterized integral membrane protein